MLGPWLKSLRTVVNKYDVDLDKLTKEAQSKLEAAEITLRSNSPTSLCNIKAFDGDLSETPGLSVGSSRGVHLTDALIKREADIKAIEMVAAGIAKVHRLNQSLTPDFLVLQKMTAVEDLILTMNNTKVVLEEMSTESTAESTKQSCSQQSQVIHLLCLAAQVRLYLIGG